MWRLQIEILLGIAIVVAFCACSKPSQTKIATENTFIGSAACISCHAEEYKKWNGSHHDWAMKLPLDSTVLGDFGDVEYESDGVRYRFYRDNGKFMVASTEKNASPVIYEVAYAFGFYPLQQYLIEFPKGQYQTLRASWDSEKNTWFHQYAGAEIDTSDWLHWTKGGQRWNTMCAECHSTNLQKNYDLATDAFNTTYSEINVSCESCHGKASDHVKWALDPESTGNSRILMKGDSQLAQLAQCAACHSRRVKLTSDGYPEIAFHNQYTIQTIGDEYYHPDGQIREEDYVFGSFIQSRMFHNNVKCSDCHDPHSLELKMEGNALCMQCHVLSYDSPEHHFHPTATPGAECINCHMTGAVYMGNDFRRDHSFRVPRPDQSVVYGTPNACTGCHTDQTDQWAADVVKTWYGASRPHHFSDILLEASRRPVDEAAREDIYQFINDRKEPAIARATAIEYLPLLGTEKEITTYLQAAKDSADIVRYQALNKFLDFTYEERSAIGLNFVNDSSRTVRIAAANLTIEQDTTLLAPQLKAYWKKAQNELVEMLNANADFPLGRMQYGDYYLRRNQINKAIASYEMALEMDPFLTQVFTNLATAYNIAGDNEKALQTLNRLLELEPQYGFGYYLRGLLSHEIGNSATAIDDLTKAIELNPMNFRYFYNLANLQLQNGQPDEAESTIEAGLALQPNSSDGQSLLDIIRRTKAQAQ